MSDPTRPKSFLAVLAFLIALVAVAATAGSGFGVRFGLWDYRTGFDILRVGAWTGLAAGGVALIAAILLLQQGRKRGFMLALVALIAGLAAFGYPYQKRMNAQSLPKIHDISTDTENPPPFRAVLKLREGARNPAQYAGPETAAAQKKGYPDIQPLIVPKGRAEAYQAALIAAAEMGWTIVAKAPAEGRIEATDTTFWFRFTDDIVIRVSATTEPGQSRIDIRSKSRVGRSDLGTNAKRVRGFLAAVKQALKI
jgi:uncharacterized protein (DUF1499 family)